MRPQSWLAQYSLPSSLSTKLCELKPLVVYKLAGTVQMYVRTVSFVYCSWWVCQEWRGSPLLNMWCCRESPSSTSEGKSLDCDRASVSQNTRPASITRHGPEGTEIVYWFSVWKKVRVTLLVHFSLDCTHSVTYITCMHMDYNIKLFIAIPCLIYWYIINLNAILQHLPSYNVLTIH